MLSMLQYTAMNIVYNVSILESFNYVTLYNEHYTLYSVQRIVYSVQRIVYSVIVQCTLYVDRC